jgi:broad specificity polyphosphatase/5'/3'-nucleotidase SurE
MCFDHRPLSRRAFLGGTVAAAATAAVHFPVAAAAAGPQQSRFGDRYVLAADRVFDGMRVLEHHAVAVRGDTITAVAPTERLRGMGRVVGLAGGTLLPGSSTCTHTSCLGECARTRWFVKGSPP